MTESLKKKILIIDDEEDLVVLLKGELESAGYEIDFAFDGESGYEKYLKGKPSLIILDLKMPKLNGFAVCKKIRRENNDLETPILMLTAVQEDADRLIGKVVGAERYITKPFSIEKLLNEIEWLVPA
ncbi:MAG: response regulator [Candidatus Aceula meridiana]|nr:response regulator [Candidatus Aceula meridiana]